MKLPAIEVIHFLPIGGTHIQDAKREAIALAVEHTCDVEFGHNEKWFKVAIQDLLLAVREVES